MGPVPVEAVVVEDEERVAVALLPVPEVLLLDFVVVSIVGVPNPFATLFLGTGASSRAHFFFRSQWRPASKVLPLRSLSSAL